VTARGDEANDRVLAELAAAGDRAAFGELTRRSLPAVRSLIRRMGAQPALADDVTQDAFVAAMRAVSTYRGESSFAAWVMRIAARLYVKRCRGNARWLSFEESGASSVVENRAGEALDLDRALELLSPSERLCVSLCHGAGFTHAELADALSMPLGTVKSHVLRGTRRLRMLLGEAP
jgi:RNA polymerase sigma-70 factor (ECF subfamily)